MIKQNYYKIERILILRNRLENYKKLNTSAELCQIVYKYIKKKQDVKSERKKKYYFKQL